MSERQYMSIKEFLEKYQIENLINNDKTIGRVKNAYWFSFCNGNNKKNYDEHKIKSYDYLDVVFFGIKNFKFSGNDFDTTFGAIKIELADEEKGLVKIRYLDKNCRGELSFNSEEVGVRENKVKRIVADIPKKCDVCSKEVLVTEYGDGTCPHCGWHQDDVALLHPTEVCTPNMVSYYKAKLLMSQGKRIHPTIEEFKEAYEQWGEMEFFYKGRMFEIIPWENYVYIHEYENSKLTKQDFTDIGELLGKAKIDGQYLKDIWDKLEGIDYM